MKLTEKSTAVSDKIQNTLSESKIRSHKNETENDRIHACVECRTAMAGFDNHSSCSYCQATPANARGRTQQRKR